MEFTRVGINSWRSGLLTLALVIAAGIPGQAHSQTAHQAAASAEPPATTAADSNASSTSTATASPAAQTAAASTATPTSSAQAQMDREHAWAHLTRAQMREKIRDGDLNLCITNSMLDSATEPVIVFHNKCNFPVNVMLCARVEGQSPGYFLILMQSSSDTRHRLYVQQGKSLHYKYNSCEKSYCTPPQSEC